MVRGLFRKMKSRPVLGGLVLSAAFLAGAAVFGLRSGGDQDEPRWGSVRQVSDATVGPLTISLAEARYSGTDTLVSFKVSSSGGSGTFAIEPGSMSLDGFDGRYSDGTVIAAPSGMMRLPPIRAGSAPTLTVREVRVDTPGQTTKLAGPFVLNLTLPGAKQLSEALQIEALAADEVTAGGIKVSATAIRSRSSTEVTYGLPEGLTQLRLPQVLGAGKDGALAPFRDKDNGDGTHTASFPATSFGAPLRIDFGPFARQVDAKAEARVTLDVATVESAPESNSLNPVQVLGTNDGSPTLVVGADVLRQPGKPSLLYVSLKGNWTSDWVAVDGNLVVSWQVLDAKGHDLRPYSWEEYFSKDPSGNVGYGTTNLIVSYTDAKALESITVRTTKKADIVRGPWTMTLTAR